MAKDHTPAPSVFLLRSVPFGESAEFTVPAGEYYVGDPCYVLVDPLYEALHEIIFPPSGGGAGETIHVTVAAPGARPADRTAHIVDVRTKHGDGRYDVRPKRPNLNLPARGLAVDSGGLALIDRRLCDPDKCSRRQLAGAAAFITLTEPGVVAVADHGLNVRGYLEVETAGSDDY